MFHLIVFFIVSYTVFIIFKSDLTGGGITSLEEIESMMWNKRKSRFARGYHKTKGKEPTIQGTGMSWQIQLCFSAKQNSLVLFTYVRTYVKILSYTTTVEVYFIGILVSYVWLSIHGTKKCSSDNEIINHWKCHLIEFDLRLEFERSLWIFEWKWSS